MSCIINAVTLRPFVEYPVAADSLTFVVTYDVMETGRSKIFQSSQPAGARAHNADTLAGLLFAKGHGSVNPGYNPRGAVHINPIIVTKGIEHKPFFLPYAAEVEDSKS
jgi:hypothetical protein